MEFLLVDGYNIINSWKDIFNLERESLEECREKLISILSNYEGYSKIRIIVVFDAHLVQGNMGRLEYLDNIVVVYTGENQTADNYIERFVYRHSEEHRVWVATSDYLEQSIVFKNGGIRITPKELKKDIEEVHENMTKDYREDKIPKRNTIMSNIKPELAEILEKIRRGE